MDIDEFARRAAQAQPLLLSIAGGMLHSPHDAADAVQETLLKGLASLPALREQGKLEAWLIKILRRECLAVLRKRKKEVPVETLPEAAPQRVEDSGVQEAMGTLGEEDARMVRMHHQEGYPVAEIAHMLRMPESLVKVRLYRARRRLRTVLLAMLITLALATAAMAARGFDVAFFFSQRWGWGEPQGVQRLANAALPVKAQESDLVWLNAQVTSTAWVEGKLAVTVEFSAKDPAATIVLPQEARGVDGIQQDHVWWDDKIMPLADWVPQDRTPVQFRVEGFGLAGTADWDFSYDWVQEGERIAYLFEYRMERPHQDVEFEMIISEGLGVEGDVAERMLEFTLGGVSGK